jgi:uncharacterized protein
VSRKRRFSGMKTAISPAVSSDVSRCPIAVGQRDKIQRTYLHCPLAVAAGKGSAGSRVQHSLRRHLTVALNCFSPAARVMELGHAACRRGVTKNDEGAALTKLTDMKIRVDDDHSVRGLLMMPHHPCACLVLAHGAGAGMTHPFMTTVAQGLAERGVATLRYQFLYMEQGSKRPDRPSLAHATVRAATAMANRLAPVLPLFAGGKSFGARMTSQAQAIEPLPEMRGLVFLGFPLHPAKKPSDERAAHLSAVLIPMLFLQGTRDALADMQVLLPTVQRLGAAAQLISIDGADHSFRVSARSGKTNENVLARVLDEVTRWIATRSRR